VVVFLGSREPDFCFQLLGPELNRGGVIRYEAGPCRAPGRQDRGKSAPPAGYVGHGNHPRHPAAFTV